MEITSFFDVVFNPVAQAKFVHTVSAGYVCASIFVLGVSAWYILKGRHIELAKRSMTVAASFGLASALSVVVLGDESGYLATENQKMKLAAIEGMHYCICQGTDAGALSIKSMVYNLARTLLR